MRYGFIGAGNMASAIIRGMVKSGVNPNEICVTSKGMESAKNLSAETGVLTGTAEHIAQNAEIMILAIKPYALLDFLELHKENILKKQPLIITIAAGKPLSFYAEILGENFPVIRVMPNINAKALASVSGVCPNKAAEPKTEQALKLFNCIGETIIIEEKHFSIFTAIAGSSPAFSYIYIDNIARAGVLNGLTKKQALEIAALSVLGSAKMILQSAEHPYELADNVCSPSGATIEGVKKLMEEGFEGVILNAVQAVVDKDNDMKK